MTNIIISYSWVTLHGAIDSILGNLSALRLASVMLLSIIIIIWRLILILLVGQRCRKCRDLRHTDIK